MTISNKDLPQFSADIYKRIALNDLVVYAAYFVAQQNKEITAEDIVAACFMLFPERFQLRGYAQWPDSTVVNKRWIDCRDKGFLQGSTATGFSLTPKGLKLAEKTAAILTGERRLFGRQKTNKTSSEIRTRAGRFVRSLETSEAFQAFSKAGVSAEISEFDFRNMLLCTMESSSNTLRNNIDQFKQSASEYERKDLLQFLDFCSNKFAGLLRETTSQHGKY